MLRVFSLWRTYPVDQRKCRICSSHFKGWMVYVEPLLGYGVHTQSIPVPPLSHIKHFHPLPFQLQSVDHPPLSPRPIIVYLS
jgi:hypothetical protein